MRLNEFDRAVGRCANTPSLSVLMDPEGLCATSPFFGGVDEDGVGLMRFLFFL